MYSIGCLRLALKDTLLYHFYGLGNGDKRIVKMYIYSNISIINLWQRYSFKIKCNSVTKIRLDWNLEVLSVTLNSPTHLHGTLHIHS